MTSLNLNVVIALSVLGSMYPMTLKAESCPPAEEYQPYTVTCPTNNYKTVWKTSDLRSSSRLFDVADCRYKGLPCYIVNLDYFSGTWNSSLSTLTFKNLSRTNPYYPRKLFCYQLRGTEGSLSEVLVSSCSLDNIIYVRPERPKCREPSMSSTTESLTCSTYKVFPQAGCRFYNMTTVLQGKVTYINGTLNNKTTDYYQPQCTIVLNLGSDIGPGVHQFKVLMYPDVPDGINFGVESDLTSDLYLIEERSSASSTVVAGIVGGVVGCILVTVLAVAIIFVLKRKGKLSSCPKSFTGKKTKQLSDNAPRAFESLDNDGYEVPVTPRPSTDYENSFSATNTDNEIPVTPHLGSNYENSLSFIIAHNEIPKVKSTPRKNITVYENTV